MKLTLLFPCAHMHAAVQHVEDEDRLVLMLFVMFTHNLCLLFLMRPSFRCFSSLLSNISVRYEPHYKPLAPVDPPNRKQKNFKCLVLDCRVFFDA